MPLKSEFNRLASPVSLVARQSALRAGASGELRCDDLPQIDDGRYASAIRA